MNFKKKLFLAIFIPSVMICGALLAYIHSQSSSSLRSEFTQRYETFNGVLARSLVQIEENADRSMQNAGRLLQRHEAEYPGIGTPGLKKLSDVIGASDVFVANPDGKYVRATNDAAETMPNLLSVCPGNSKLLGRTSAFGTSPIVASPKDGKPYKVLVVSNTVGTRFLEVSYPADYIAKTLSDAIGADRGIQSVALYTSEGTPLGEFGPGVPTNQTARAPLEWDGKEGVEFVGDRAVFTKRIPLSDADCCECKAIQAKSKHGYGYILRTSASAAVLTSSLAQLRNIMATVAVAAMGFALVLSFFISYFLLGRLNKLRKAIDGISSEEQVKDRVPGEGKDEIGVLATSFNRMLERLEKSHAKFLRSEKAKLTLRMTSQVAYDIRSPLAAFNVLESDSNQVPRERLQLLRSAINRIRDIANNLLIQRPDLEDASDAPRKDSASVKLVSNLLEPIVSEMRAHAKPGVTVECGLDAKSYGWYAYVQASEFQSVISGLVKQAIDSIEVAGKVRIQLSRADHDLVITISDDGSDTAASDLKSARGALEVWGGRIEVKAETGVGTERRISLPMAEAPFWCVDKIEIPSNTSLVVVDDDPSIHHVWRRTFDQYQLQKNDCKLVCFATTEEFSKWLDENPKRKRQTLFFIDYEYTYGMENGLELIERHGIQSQSVLVTNRFEERGVLEVCARLRVKMIPKTMLGFVPVESSLEWRSPDRLADHSPTLEI